jgi:hypothetical protein
MRSTAWSQEERNIVLTRKRKQGTWISQIMRRNCLIEHVIEGTRIKGIRHKLLLNDLKEKKIPKFERRCPKLQYLEDLLWKKLWTCCRALSYKINFLTSHEEINKIKVRFSIFS